MGCGSESRSKPEDFVSGVSLLIAHQPFRLGLHPSPASKGNKEESLLGDDPTGGVQSKRNGSCQGLNAAMVGRMPLLPSLFQGLTILLIIFLQPKAMNHVLVEKHGTSLLASGARGKVLHGYGMLWLYIYNL